MAWSDTLSNPRLRRWDQRGSDIVSLDAGAVPIVESDGTPLTWLDLEDGIQVAFDSGGDYHSGDYWLIPARVATQGILWPAQGAADAWQAPQGIVHHYAPLGVLIFNTDGLQVTSQCRQCLSLAQTTCLVPMRQVLDNATTAAPRPGSKPRKAAATNAGPKAAAAKRRR